MQISLYFSTVQFRLNICLANVKLGVRTPPRLPTLVFFLNRTSRFRYCFLKSASSLVLKLISDVMQTALVLSDKMKSLSMIKNFSDYSFGISILVWKILPRVGSNSSCSTYSPQVFLVSLSVFIIIFLACLSPTSTTRTKTFINVRVDDAALKLSDGRSSGRSVAIQPNNMFFFLSRF